MKKWTTFSYRERQRRSRMTIDQYDHLLGRRKGLALGALILVILLVLAYLPVKYLLLDPLFAYRNAVRLEEKEQDYESAYRAFYDMGDYRDSVERLTECEYLLACQLNEEGRTDDAYPIFRNLIGYRDSAEILRSSSGLREEEEAWKAGFREGALVTFGRFFQARSRNRGRTPVEWRVLKQEGSRFLLIAEKGLDCKYYNLNEDTTWETSTIRAWMNTDLAGEMFSDAEWTCVCETDCPVPVHPVYKADPGNATKDKLFLMSYDELMEWFPTEESRLCECTYYAINRGANSGSKWCNWWLRTPGKLNSTAMAVISSGDLYDGNVYYSPYTVRPMMWIDLDALSY